MRFSVQQIKYDFLYAIKEFDSEGEMWKLVTSAQPPTETLGLLGHDSKDYIFIGKPAGTPRAAQIVKDFFVRRFGVEDTGACDGDGVAEWVIMFRSKQSITGEADLLKPAATAKA